MLAIAEEVELPDAMGSVRQHIDQEAADELAGFEGHRFSGRCRSGNPSNENGPCRYPWTRGGC
jgi:hypothetical protein